MNGRASYNNFISLLAFEEFGSFSEQEQGKKKFKKEKKVYNSKKTV